MRRTRTGRDSWPRVVRGRCEGWDSNSRQTACLAPLGRCDWLCSNPSVRLSGLAVARPEECEGWDSNPWTPTRAGLKPAAVGLAWLPSRRRRRRAVRGVDLPASGQVGFGTPSRQHAGPRGAGSRGRVAGLRPVVRGYASVVVSVPAISVSVAVPIGVSVSVPIAGVSVPAASVSVAPAPPSERFAVAVTAESFSV